MRVRVLSSSHYNVYLIGWYPCQSALVTLLLTLCLVHSPAPLQAGEPALTIIKNGKARAQMVLFDAPQDAWRMSHGGFTQMCVKSIFQNGYHAYYNDSAVHRSMA